MSDHQIDAILDACIEEILEGRATLEASLSRWPEERAELEPLLHAAIEMKDLPAPEIVPDPARRAAFMAALASTPQQHARRRVRLPSLPTLALPTFVFAGTLPRFALVGGAASVAFVFILAIALMQGGTQTAAAATLTVFSGDIQQRAASDATWSNISDGADLRQGISLRTGAEGRALVTFGDGSTASLEPDTEITLTRVVIGDARQIEIGQTSGRLWNDVVTNAAASYLVRTPHALVEAHGTVFETIVDTETSVATAEGAVQVVTPDATEDVLRGQVVRATAEALGQPEDVALIGEITLRAPLAGTMTSPRGGSTGILPTGLIVQQIPGVTTSGLDEGPQHIFVGTVEPGVYLLWLRRFDDGDGIVVVETPNGRLNIPVPADVNSARIRFAIDIVNGGVFMRALDTEVERDVPEPEVRVVETERGQNAVDLTVAARSRPAATEAAAFPVERDGADDDRANDDRVEGERDKSRGDGSRNDRRRDDDDRDADDRDADRDPDEVPPATAATTPDRDEDETFRRFENRLHAAIQAAIEGDDSALQATLEDLLSEGRRTDADRLADLDDAMRGNPAAQAIVVALVASGATPQFAAALPDALDEVDRRLRGRLQQALGSLDLRQDEQPGERDGQDDSDRDDDDRDNDRRGRFWPWD